MSSEFITLLANLALTLSFIVAVIFGIAQVRQSSRDRRERLTLETLRTFTTREFAELIQYVNSGKVPTSTEQMRTLPPNEQIMFIQFGQIMESLGQLVFDRFINIDLVDKTLGSYVITTWEKYKTLFLDLREKSNDPYLGEYFQWLAERIEKRMRENPRKPFYQSKHSS